MVDCMLNNSSGKTEVNKNTGKSSTGSVFLMNRGGEMLKLDTGKDDFIRVQLEAGEFFDEFNKAFAMVKCKNCGYTARANLQWVAFEGDEWDVPQEEDCMEYKFESACPQCVKHLKVKILLRWYNNRLRVIKQKLWNCKLLLLDSAHELRRDAIKNA